jgi:hypothetical protein
MCLLAGWLAATVRAVWTRVMNTCYCVVSRFLFLPPSPGILWHLVMTGCSQIVNIISHIQDLCHLMTVIQRASGL